MLLPWDNTVVKGKAHELNQDLPVQVPRGRRGIKEDGGGKKGKKRG